jgi:hypothetical protein
MAGMHLFVRPNLNGCQSLAHDRLLANDRDAAALEVLRIKLSSPYRIDLGRHEKQVRLQNSSISDQLGFREDRFRDRP